ncbi:hypothetical protein M153_1370005758 [Pseudoloma neurophilia]|uniref:Uncharacterized protein n=1 Tax=Pseudoloma neurophilia TaxID=146866 RepID=A0A0R0LZY0_9MICR|nr:hypothetical protein M153_1370005758 [Pseudoloma neurophilia]
MISEKKKIKHKISSDCISIARELNPDNISAFTIAQIYLQSYNIVILLYYQNLIREFLRLEHVSTKKSIDDISTHDSQECFEKHAKVDDQRKRKLSQIITFKNPGQTEKLLLNDITNID